MVKCEDGGDGGDDGGDGGGGDSGGDVGDMLMKKSRMPVRW